MRGCLCSCLAAFAWVVASDDDSGFFCPPTDRYARLARRVPLGDGLFFPVLASHREGAVVDTAIMVLHGRLHDAEPYYDVMLDAVYAAQCAPERTLVVAAAVPDKACTAGSWNGGPGGQPAPFWGSSTSQWTFGGESDSIDTWTTQTCTLDTEVVIKNKDGKYLGASNTYYVFQTADQVDNWEKFTLKDAGSGEVFIENYQGATLKDHLGTLDFSLSRFGSTSRTLDEQWTVLDAGDGWVCIQSRKGNHLSAHQGRLTLSQLCQADEQFQVLRRTDETNACSGTRTHDNIPVNVFTAYDKVVEWMQTAYSGVSQVLVTGFSAGGQSIQRWAIMSPEGTDGHTTLGTPLRILVGSPSTLAYLNDKRPILNCTPDLDTTCAHTCSKFAAPESSSRRRGVYLQKSCSGSWDDWGYGLSALEAGSPDADSKAQAMSKYLQETTSVHDSEFKSYVPARFRSKDVAFFVGAQDTKSCNVGSCSDSCAAMATGSNRLQRMAIFASHLRDQFPAYSPRVGFFDGGHDNWACFHSTIYGLWAWSRGYVMLDQILQDEGEHLASYMDRFYKVCECASLCDAEQRCSSFSYHPDWGDCHLKAKCVDPHRAPEPVRYDGWWRTFYKKCGANVAGLSDAASRPSVWPDAWAAMGATTLIAVCGIVFASVASFRYASRARLPARVVPRYEEAPLVDRDLDEPERDSHACQGGEAVA